MILTVTISLFICQLCGEAFSKHLTKLVCSIRTETWQDLPLLKMSIAQKNRWWVVIRAWSNHVSLFMTYASRKGDFCPWIKSYFITLWSWIHSPMHWNNQSIIKRAEKKMLKQCAFILESRGEIEAYGRAPCNQTMK